MQAIMMQHRRALLQGVAPNSTVRHIAAVQRLNTTRAAAAAADVAAAPTSAATPSVGAWKPSAKIRMLYDGECSLCMKEVNFLRGRDAAAGAIDFVDIASPEYNPAVNVGITFEQAMERIHAIRPDGSVIRDVAVFRALYEAVGLGWVYSITQLPAVEAAANKLYMVWAKHRTQLTGREALDVIVARHAANRQSQQQPAGSLCRDPNGGLLQDSACELPGGGSAQRS